MDMAISQMLQPPRHYYVKSWAERLRGSGDAAQFAGLGASARAWGNQKPSLDGKSWATDVNGLVEGKIDTGNQPDFPMKIMGFSCNFSRKPIN